MVFRFSSGSYRFERKCQHSKSEELKFVSIANQDGKHRDDQNNFEEIIGSKDKKRIIDAI